jgi:hypothetical protein
MALEFVSDSLKQNKEAIKYVDKEILRMCWLWGKNCNLKTTKNYKNYSF